MSKVLVQAGELLSDPLDVRVDGSIRDIGVVRIALFHELLPGLDVAGSTNQGVEHHELGHRQRNRLIAPAGGVAPQIENQIADGEKLLLASVVARSLSSESRRKSTLTRATSSRMENGLQR